MRRGSGAERGRQAVLRLRQEIAAREAAGQPAVVSPRERHTAGSR